MFEVVKRALDRYTEPKQNENFSHVILTKSEYQQKENLIYDLNRQIKQAERDYKIKNDEYAKSANAKIAEIQKQADERIAEARAEMEKHKSRADNFENANKNLIRVAIERANAQRGLSPKKEHNGYVLVYAEEFIYNCECSVVGEKRTRMLRLPCFRIRLQSPYPVNLDLQTVMTLISRDIIEKEIYKKIGTHFNYNWEGATDEEILKLWREEKNNFDFRTSYKANLQQNLWEIEYLTRYMINVPLEMLAKK